MRRFLSAHAIAAALLFSVPALANDTYAGTIASSGASTTNLTTATPFTLWANWSASVQCDADSYVAEGPASVPPTVTSSNGLKITAGSLFGISLKDPSNSGSPYFAIGILPVSGSANCKVFVAPPGVALSLSRYTPASSSSGGGAGVSGTPTSGMVAIWDGGSAVGGDANLTWDLGASGKLVVDGGVQIAQGEVLGGNFTMGGTSPTITCSDATHGPLWTSNAASANDGFDFNVATASRTATSTNFNFKENGSSIFKCVAGAGGCTATGAMAATEFDANTFQTKGGNAGAYIGGNKTSGWGTGAGAVEVSNNNSSSALDSILRGRVGGTNTTAGWLNNTGDWFARAGDPIAPIFSGDFAVGVGWHVNTQALTAGSATVTFSPAYSGTPVCFCQDAANTATAVTRCNATSTTLTLGGTSADTIAYACVGAR